jgi:hypothetical protein
MPPLKPLNMHGPDDDGRVHADCAQCMRSVRVLMTENDLHRTLANERAEQLAELRAELADAQDKNVEQVQTIRRIEGWLMDARDQATQWQRANTESVKAWLDARAEMMRRLHSALQLIHGNQRYDPATIDAVEPIVEGLYDLWKESTSAPWPGSDQPTDVAHFGAASLDELFRDAAKWASETFPDSTWQAKSLHLIEEAIEVYVANPDRPTITPDNEGDVVVPVYQVVGQALTKALRNPSQRPAEEIADVLLICSHLMLTNAAADPRLEFARKLNIVKKRQWTKDPNGVMHRRNLATGTCPECGTVCNLVNNRITEHGVQVADGYTSYDQCGGTGQEAAELSPDWPALAEQWTRDHAGDLKDADA